MVWGAVAAIGISALQYSGSKKSARAAKRAARETAEMNAESIRQETAEVIRRSKLQNKQILGQATADTGGSGVRNTGSTANTISALGIEQQKQLDWVQKSSDSRVANILRGGELAANQYNSDPTQALGTLTSAYTSGMFNFGSTNSYQAQQPNYFSGGNSGSSGGYDPMGYNWDKQF